MIFSLCDLIFIIYYYPNSTLAMKSTVLIKDNFDHQTTADRRDHFWRHLMKPLVTHLVGLGAP